MKIMMKLSGLSHWSWPRKQILGKQAMDRSMGLGTWVVAFALCSAVLSLGARGARIAVQFALALVAIVPLALFMFSGFGAAKIAQVLGWGMWAFKARGWMDEQANRVDDAVMWCEAARLECSDALWCLPVLGWAWAWTWAARIAAARRLARSDSNRWGMNAYALAWWAKKELGREVWRERDGAHPICFEPEDELMALSSAHPMGWGGWMMGWEWSSVGMDKARARSMFGRKDWVESAERLLDARAAKHELEKAVVARPGALNKSARRV